MGEWVEVLVVPSVGWCWGVGVVCRGGFGGNVLVNFDAFMLNPPVRREADRASRPARIGGRGGFDVVASSVF